MSNQNKFKLPIPLPIILGLLAMTTSLSIDILLPALMQISQDFTISIEQSGKVVTAFLIGFSVGQLIFGPIADSLGSKVILIFGTLLFFICNLLSVFAPTIYWLFLFRVFQGFGAASIGVSINAYLRDRFSGNDLSRMLSLVTQVVIIAPLINPVIGGYLVVHFGWRAILWMCASFALACLLLVLISLPETLSRVRKPIHWREVLTNYKKIIVNKYVSGYIFINSFSFAGMFAFITISANLYISDFNIPTEYFGFVYSLNIIAMMLMTFINSKYVEKVGFNNMLLLGMGLQVFSVILLVIAVTFDLSFIVIIFGVAMFLGCVPLISSNCMTGILSDLPHLAGTASALAGCIRFGISALAGLLVMSLSMSNVKAMLSVMLICIILMLAAYCLVKSTKLFDEKRQSVRFNT